MPLEDCAVVPGERCAVARMHGVCAEVGRCLIPASAIVLAVPLTLTVWYLLTVESGAPEESLWLIVVASCVSPMSVSALADHVRAEQTNNT